MPSPPVRPNLLLILVDQLHWPQLADDNGMLAPIKQILSFQGDLSGNPFARFFPGFVKLREHGVVLTDHTIAESACIPSRASLMTGQYGLRTGVTQTDGLFKSGDAANFPWLPHDGTPTLGDWFQAAGYSTHYFGKWHVSSPPDHSLQSFGFQDWELSWPEPHGALLNNLGTFRDLQFADLATSFLRNRGLGLPHARSTAQADLDDPSQPVSESTPPFLAVCSFTNPHDIAAYPTLPRGLKPSVLDPVTEEWVPIDNVGPGGAVPVPPAGSRSTAPPQGSLHVDLNPLGLPQHCATPPTTWDADLANKPRAHREYAVKLGLGLAAKVGLNIGEATGADPEEATRAAVEGTLAVPIPFNLQDDAEAATAGFLQYYVYMISMVDRHILRVLESLEAAGLRESTHVVFASDHGEMGGAHGMMMEKWHVGYQEVVHVPVVVSSPLLQPHRHITRAVAAQTSHIDLLPTLLGLAGIPEDERCDLRTQLSLTHQAGPLPGADLTPVLKGDCDAVVEPDGTPREGVLFVTDDCITEPLPADTDPHNVQGWKEYEVFSAAVDALRAGVGRHAPMRWLSPGGVVQPNHVRAVRSGPWKLVRMCDPWSDRPEPDEWELYNLRVDGIEAVNLLRFDQPFPTPIPAAELPPGLKMSPREVAAQAKTLRVLLERLERRLLAPYPSAHPTAKT